MKKEFHALDKIVSPDGLIGIIIRIKPSVFLRPYHICITEHALTDIPARVLHAYNEQKMQSEFTII